jgi:hypothetical protein
LGSRPGRLALGTLFEKAVVVLAKLQSLAGSDIAPIVPALLAFAFVAMALRYFGLL